MATFASTGRRRELLTVTPIVQLVYARLLAHNAFWDSDSVRYRWHHRVMPTDVPDPGRYRGPRSNFGGSRKGKAPANKGKKLPPEILTPDEVAALFEAIEGDGLLAVRNRAMLALMYRARVKVGALTKLAVRHYAPETGVLIVPPHHMRQVDESLKLDPIARKMLDDWLEVRVGLRLRATAPLFVVLAENRGRELREQNIRVMLETLRVRARIQKRVRPEGLRASRTQHKESETGRFESGIASYISAEGFRQHYRAAYQKWVDAHQILETAPDRQASTIGHLCREAIIEFSDQLAREYDVGPFEPLKTKAKMRAVFSKREDVSTTLTHSLLTLLAYWESLIELANRQEHGRKLTADDGRAIVFQTMLVMREIDLALAR